MKKKGNKIGWCDKTTNPVWGCPNGCKWCYARPINDRFKRIPDFTKPQFFPNALKEFRTKEPMIIFIDSMSDIGHWEYEWQCRVLSAIGEEPQNIYLALTKNYDKIKSLRLWINEYSTMICGISFYIGATVTNNAQAQQVIEAGGADFISFEPLMERIDGKLLDKLTCRWWIIGDLTKAGKPQGVTQEAWIYDMLIRATIGIPVFMKESLRGIMDNNFMQQFPAGWKQ